MSIENVKMKHEEKLMRLPNVTGVGIGEKDGRKVIVVFVTQKLPESSLKRKDIVPKKLGEYETDVQETGFITAQLE